MIDIPTLITKLRSAPQKVGTFDRGDPKPLDEYRVVLTGEEREWLAMMLEPWTPSDKKILDLNERVLTRMLSRALDDNEKMRAEIERLKRTSGEG